MKVDNLRHFDEWPSAFAPLQPGRLWQTFRRRRQHPPLTFSIEASAVYSANIEGNSIDLNFFLNSKLDAPSHRFKARERTEIEDLIAAYEFARTHRLNETNLLMAHKLLSRTLLPRSQRGRYRQQLMFVYSQAGIEYAAVEPEFVAEKTQEAFQALSNLDQRRMTTAQAFYFAALLHLVFVHIHPFQDGNGRAAGLLEKWLLAQFLDTKEWHIPSEKYYQEHRSAYYQRLKIGLNYYTLDYGRCVPFLQMLPEAMAGADSQRNKSGE